MGLPALAQTMSGPAFAGDEVLGGRTAHTPPMTRSANREVFLYDIAVREVGQRLGIGRHLVDFLRKAAAAEAIDVMFVPAGNEDSHAFDFYGAIGGEESPVTVFMFARDPGAVISSPFSASARELLPRVISPLCPQRSGKTFSSRFVRILTKPAFQISALRRICSLVPAA